MILKAAIFLFHLLSIEAASPDCSAVSLLASFTGGGSLVATTSGAMSFPGTCSVEIARWSGVSVSGISKFGPCATFNSTSFNRSDVGVSTPFTFGTRFELRFVYYSTVGATSLNNAAKVCQGAVVGLTPPACRRGSILSSLSLVKKPYGALEAYLNGSPTSVGKCVFLLSNWPNVDGEAEVQDCTRGYFNQTVTSGGSFAYGVSYSIRFLAYISANASLSTDQPLCGVNGVSLTPEECTSSLSVSEVAYGRLRVTPSGTRRGRSCGVYLSRWNGTVVRSVSAVQFSSACTDTVFDGAQYALAFAYGGEFQFEIAEFSSGTVTSNTNPLCSRSIPPVTLRADCNATSDLVVVRPDPETLAITLISSQARPYGVCQVSAVSVQSVELSPVVTFLGSCAGSFRFTGSSLGVPDGTLGTKSVGLIYSFFPLGTANNALPACTSPAPYIDTPTSSTCTQTLLVTELGVGSLFFRIGAPVPESGTCSLLVSGCGTSPTTTKTFPFSSCGLSLSLNFTQINSLVGGVVPGTNCTFTYQYVRGAVSCIATNAASSVPMRVFYPISQPYAVSDKLPVNVGAMPAELTSYLVPTATRQCRLYLVDCGGIPSSRVFNITGCPAGIFNLTDSAIVAGQTCRVRLLFFTSQSASNTATNYAGDSGLFAFTTMYAPIWGPAQTIAASLLGDDCLALAWAAPADLGGIPISCYDVQRRDNSSAFTTVGTCLSASSTSFRACGVDTYTTYAFRVIAVNVVGRSLPLELSAFTVDRIRSVPASTFTAPDPATKNFVGGLFPVIEIRSYIQLASGATVDSSSTDRLFVGRLVNRGKPDPITALLTAALDPSDTDYTTATLPLPSNSPPVFTLTFAPNASAPGYYRLDATSQPPSGAYSLAVYSLENGGFAGQYWTNRGLIGIPGVSRKDSALFFIWYAGGSNNTYAASARWTGFVEAAFSEEYTFIFSTRERVRMWIDDVSILDNWLNPCPGECSGKYVLNGSDQQASVGSRKFHLLRIEFARTGATDQSQLDFFWSSASQFRSRIPPTRMFTGSLINNSTLRTINVIPGALSPNQSTITVPSGSQPMNSTITVYIQARDALGNRMETTADSFSGSLVCLSCASPYILNVTSSLDPGSLGVHLLQFNPIRSGVFRVDVAEVASGTSLGNSGLNLTVAQGSISAVFPASVVLSPSPPRAGSPITAFFSVLDMSNSSIDGSDTNLSSISIVATFQYDLIASSRLPVDDVLNRTARYGTISTPSQIGWNATRRTFFATFNVPLAGSYSVTYNIEGGTGPVTDPSLWVIQASRLISPTYTVITSTPFPPTTQNVGSAILADVQLRDQYLNCLADTPTNLQTIVMALTGNADAPCSPSVSLPGQYSCSLTPTNRYSSGMRVGIIVNQVQAVTITNTLGYSVYTQGPFALSVKSMTVSASGSVLLNVPLALVAGSYSNITLVLRDASGTALTFTELGGVIPTISVSLSTPTNASYSVISPSLFTLNSDATVTLPLICDSLATNISLRVTLNGQVVPNPVQITDGAITCGGTIGDVSLVRLGNSLADVSTKLAGTEINMTFVIPDSLGNILPATKFPINVSFVNNDTGELYVSYLDLDAGILNAPPLKGKYSISIQIGRPGGLNAFYYSDTDLTNQISTTGDPLIPANANPTMIEGPIWFRGSEVSPFGGVAFRSVRWSGAVRASSSGVWTINVFSVGGGVRMYIGGILLVDTWNSLTTNSTQNRTFDSGKTTSIVVEFRRISASAIPTLTVSWKKATDPAYGYSLIAPSSLFTPYSINPEVYQWYGLTVQPYPEASNISMVSMGTFTQGTAENVVILLLDRYGNNFTSSEIPPCADGTTGDPNCFFYIRTDPALSTVGAFSFASVDSNSATYVYAPLVLPEYGPYSVYVSILDSLGAASTSVVGSPFSVDSYPSGATVANSSDSCNSRDKALLGSLYSPFGFYYACAATFNSQNRTNFMNCLAPLTGLGLAWAFVSSPCVVCHYDLILAMQENCTTATSARACYTTLYDQGTIGDFALCTGYKMEVPAVTGCPSASRMPSFATSYVPLYYNYQSGSLTNFTGRMTLIASLYPTLGSSCRTCYQGLANDLAIKWRAAVGSGCPSHNPYNASCQTELSTELGRFTNCSGLTLTNASVERCSAQEAAWLDSQNITGLLYDFAGQLATWNSTATTANISAKTTCGKCFQRFVERVGNINATAPKYNLDVCRWNTSLAGCPYNATLSLLDYCAGVPYKFYYLSDPIRNPTTVGVPAGTYWDHMASLFSIQATRKIHLTKVDIWLDGSSRVCALRCNYRDVDNTTFTSTVNGVSTCTAVNNPTSSVWFGLNEYPTSVTVGWSTSAIDSIRFLTNTNGSYLFGLASSTTYTNMSMTSGRRVMGFYGMADTSYMRSLGLIGMNISTGLGELSAVVANFSSFVIFDSQYSDAVKGFISFVPKDQSGNFFNFSTTPTCEFKGLAFPACLFELNITGGDVSIDPPSWVSYTGGAGMVTYPVTFWDMSQRYNVTHYLRVASGGTNKPIQGGLTVVTRVTTTTTTTRAPTTTRFVAPTIQPYARAVFSAGLFGSSPWGNGSSFIDPMAEWIWNTPNSGAGAPVNVFINFWTSFRGVAGQSATLHAIVDNQGSVYVNDRLLGNIVAGGWTYSSYSRWTFTLEPVNVIRIYAWNQGGSAGLLAAVVNTTNSSQVFTRTNASWLYWDPSIPTTTSTTTTSAPDFAIPAYAKAAPVVCQVGCIPWGYTTFVDNTSSWIWDRSTAAKSDAPMEVYMNFYKTFTGVPGQNATLHAIVDNFGEVYVNGKLLGVIATGGWATSSYSRWTFLLEPLNVIRVWAWNQGWSFAGLLVSVVNTSNPDQVFAKTDSSWVYKTSAVNWNMSDVSFFANIDWKCIAYGNGTFVALSAGINPPGVPKLRTSPDGSAWSSRALTIANNWQSLVYGAGLFVAVASSGAGNRVMTSSDGGKTWTARNSAADKSWMGITFGDGLFVAVGYDGACMTSPDGIVWTSQTTDNSNSWEAVAYGNGRFVAVASAGDTFRVMTSTDGATWTLKEAVSTIQNDRTYASFQSTIGAVYPDDYVWQDITFGGGLFVAVGRLNVPHFRRLHTMCSADGNSWKFGFFGTALYDVLLRSVVYGNGVYVAVGSPIRTYGSIDGTNWYATVAPYNSQASWSSIAYGPDIFVAVADAATGYTGDWVMSAGAFVETIYTDPSIPRANTVMSYGSHQTFWSARGFYHVQFVGTFVDPIANVIWFADIPSNQIYLNFWKVFPGEEGKNVTLHALSGDRALAYVNDVFLGAVQSCRWNAPYPKYTFRMKAVNTIRLYATHLGGLPGIIAAVVDTSDPNVVYVHTDTTWVQRNTYMTWDLSGPSTFREIDWKGVTYGDGVFVAVSAGLHQYNTDSRKVMTSPDGIMWTFRQMPAQNQWQSVTYGNGMFVAVSNSGTGNRVMLSSDMGKTWVSGYSASDSLWMSVTYGNGLFVAVGYSGACMTSMDGITWTSQTTNNTNNWESIAFGNGTFVAVSSEGDVNRVMTSPDGISWTLRASAGSTTSDGAIYRWNDIAYGGGIFVAVGGKSYVGQGLQVMRSLDGGITWSFRTYFGNGDWSDVLRAVAYGDGIFVTVGSHKRGWASVDGDYWAPSTQEVTHISWWTVAYGKGVFVAMAGNTFEYVGGNWLMRAGRVDPNDQPYPSTTVEAWVLCGFYCVWDWNHPNRYFPDRSAYWIWNSNNAHNGASAYVYINFWRSFDGYEGRNATIHANVDNVCAVYVNGVRLSDEFWYYGKFNFTMQATNMIRIYAYNTDGPAGLISSVYNETNHVLVRTDKMWVTSLA